VRALLALALLAAAPAAAQDLIAFRTPSGNIHCMGGADWGVDCELVRMDTGPLLARPWDCDLDWGQRFAVGPAGQAGMVCHGDTVQDPNGAVLPYGSSLAVGGVTCTSRESGLECRNAQGHGFRLSRGGQSLF
jgi:hypothetical protein